MMRRKPARERLERSAARAAAWTRFAPVVQGQRRQRTELITRAMDLAVATLVLVIVSPLMAVVAFAIRITSPGPAFFRQVRVGYQEQPFKMLKLRTMYLHCDDALHRDFVTRMLAGEDPRQSGPDGLFKLERDPRVTPIGSFLRRTSLDELPQLLNVLRGEMSLVGPRPALPWEAELYPPQYRQRFEVRPGITGLWQVEGRSRLRTQDALQLDVEYVNRRCVALNLYILARTLPVVLDGKEAG
jgi:lipopolysaccharide/colanic/teichoic acid biosynthesis glycosyltransferase